MIITNVIVEKIEQDHPRHPDNLPPGAEVYRCETTDTDGNQFEAAFVHTPAFGAVTPASVGTMLKLFARAVEQMGEKKSEAA